MFFVCLGMHRKSMEAAHTLSSDLIKESKEAAAAGGYNGGFDGDDESCSGDEHSDTDNTEIDTKPNIQNIQHGVLAATMAGNTTGNGSAVTSSPNIKDDFRSHSIATLRAKAQEHSARFAGMNSSNSSVGNEAVVTAASLAAAAMHQAQQAGHVQFHPAF